MQTSTESSSIPPFHNSGEDRARARALRPVFWLAAAICAVSALIFLAPAPIQGRLISALAFWPAEWRAVALTSGGAPVRLGLSLVGHLFIHADLVHLAFNLGGLLAFGAPVALRLSVARAIGGVRATLLFLAFFFASGAVGAAAFTLANAGYSGFLVGASGGILGLVGGVLRMSLRSRAASRADPLGFAPIFAPGTLAILGLIVIAEILTATAAIDSVLLPRNIGWEAHIGGLLFGLVAFPAFCRKRALHSA